MIITCPKCGHQGKLDPSRIPQQGARARCPKCQNSFSIQRPDMAQAAASPPPPSAPPPPPRESQAPEAEAPGTASPAPGAEPALGFAGDSPASASDTGGGLSLKGPSPEAAASRDVACTGCLKLFSEEEITRVGDRALCRSCQEAYQAKGQAPGPPRARPSYGMPAKKQRLEYAGFWIRGGAYLVDIFILFLVWHFVLSPVFMKVATRMMTDTAVPLTFNVPQDPTLTDPAQMEEMLSRMQDSMNQMQSRMIIWVWSVNLVGALLVALYFIALEGGSGQTIGKKMLSLRVVTADGDSIGYAKAFVRYVGKIFGAIILGIGFFMAAFDGEKRALHDRLCESRVVKE